MIGIALMFTPLEPEKYWGKKKNIKVNYFLIFGFIVKNIKDYKIKSKFLKILHIFKFVSPYIMERNK